MALLHHRHIGPLISIWISAFAIAGGLYWLQAVVPALVDIVTPIYIVVGVILIFVTVHWIRGRVKQRRNGERRHADRRQAERPM
jgi:uncharacterized membrane protein